MRKVFWGLLALFIFCLGCRQNIKKFDCEKLVKVEITDSSFKKILTEYIKAYNFNGKGIYLATIIRSNDTVKYYVDVSFTEQNLNTKLKHPPYYFYDIISDRVVIVHTKYEDYLKPIHVKFDCDTMLSKYFDDDTVFRWREVYLLEFAKWQDVITKKDVQFYPY